MRFDDYAFRGDFPDPSQPIHLREEEKNVLELEGRCDELLYMISN